MATLLELYQFEKHFEDAAETFLESATGWQVFKSASDESFITPRVEIEFQLGEAVEPVDAPIANNLTEFRKYDAAFVARIITDPTDPTQDRDAHFAAVGKVRVALMRSASNWDASTLPLYGLKYIRPVDSQRSAVGDFQLTALTYEIRFAVKENAWPTTTTTTTPAP